MSNFRTTPDLLDGVLRRCGELTSANGTSPWQTAALLYLNQIHYTVINGGNELNVDVDEPWIWARARQPIVLQLLPSITTGTVSLTQGSNAGTFATAPQVNGANASLQDWLIQPQNFPEIYRISSHVAGSMAFSIDSLYPQVTNSSSNFKAFCVDYDLVTGSINIDAHNDTLDFSEDGATTLTATLTHGGQSPAGFATAVALALTTASTVGNTYAGSYDVNQRLFSISSNASKGSIFQIYGASPNYYRSAWESFGFDYNNLTGGISYTGVYPLSGVVRLTQPARIYYGQDLYGGNNTGQVGALDVVAFDQQYPLMDIEMGTPDSFCVMRENNNGTLRVRFNKYLNTSTNMRVEFEHIGRPKDLFNNQYSIPVVPRKYLKVLEFGASYYLCNDKSDSKAQTYLAVAKSALDAMMRANRRELQRTGVNFGNVIARPDLMPNKKNYRSLLFGYDAGNI